MKRYSALRRRFPAFYNQLVLQARREQLRLSMAEVARQAGLPEKNVQNAFLGTAKNHTVYPLCVTLGLDWLQVHNLELKKSDFHLAVLGTNGNGSRAAVR